MRLIDADALVAKIMVDAPDFMDGGSSITKAFIAAMVNTKSVTPTIDAAPVVRCKDCVNDGTSRCPCHYSGDPHIDWDPDDNWFCADGKRR